MKRYLLIGLLPLLSCHSAMNKTHALRLRPGADLRRELQSYAERNGIEAGWIVTCAGSLTDYHIRFANQPEGSGGAGHFEIVSLTGTLSKNGSHLHIAIADSAGRTIGGHLLEGNRIYTTAEIVLQEDPSLVFTREKDGTTPWEELQIRKTQ
ncbi:PPC domain-containing DNA-binding protein [Flaviaesturariibacter aridisoli]|nr:PPC domain-containing DNA-binding protein [Flaviaesturariibacter aridisoli]